MGADTITLKYDGTEKVFKVARDAKVAMNGRKGYSLDDLADTNNSQRQIVTLTIKDGIAHSLDVTLTLPKGKKLWGPGMGPGQIQLRRMNAMSP